MNTVDRIKQICKERKIPISKLERDCGFANGYIGQLKRGTIQDNRLKIISKYFNVPVDYLLGAENYKHDLDTNTWVYEIPREDMLIIEKAMLNTDTSKRLVAYAKKLIELSDMENL